MKVTCNTCQQDTVVVGKVIDKNKFVCYKCLRQDTPKEKEFSGVTSSVQPRYSLLTTHFLQRVVERCEAGIARKGVDKAWNAIAPNFVAPLSDIEFAIERCSHIINHALRLRDKLVRKGWKLEEPFEIGDDDAGAIGWGAMFLCEVTRELSKGKE